MLIIKFILEVVQLKNVESLIQKQAIENQHGIYFPKQGKFYEFQPICS